MPTLSRSSRASPTRSSPPPRADRVLVRARRAHAPQHTQRLTWVKPFPSTGATICRPEHARVPERAGVRSQFHPRSGTHTVRLFPHWGAGCPSPRRTAEGLRSASANARGFERTRTPASSFGSALFERAGSSVCVRWPSPNGLLLWGRECASCRGGAEYSHVRVARSSAETHPKRLAHTTVAWDHRLSSGSALFERARPSFRPGPLSASG
jgi:hypothetical protein